MFSKLSLAFILVISMQLVASKDIPVSFDDGNKLVDCILEERDAIFALGRDVASSTVSCVRGSGRSDVTEFDLMKQMFDGSSILDDITGCVRQGLRDNRRAILLLAARIGRCSRLQLVASKDIAVTFDDDKLVDCILEERDAIFALGRDVASSTVSCVRGNGRSDITEFYLMKQMFDGSSIIDDITGCVRQGLRDNRRALLLLAARLRRCSR